MDAGASRNRLVLLAALVSTLADLAEEVDGVVVDDEVPSMLRDLAERAEEALQELTPG